MDEIQQFYTFLSWGTVTKDYSSIQVFDTMDKVNEFQANASSESTLHICDSMEEALNEQENIDSYNEDLIYQYECQMEIWQ